MNTYTLCMFFLFGLTVTDVLANDPVVLKGKVQASATTMPIPGVAVYIPELNRGLITDEKGEFIIGSLPLKRLTVQFTLLGYKSVIKEFDVSAFKEAQTILMEESTTTIDEVVVSGAYIMSRENSPIAIEKINREELLKMPSPGLMSSLARMPGISEVSLGPGIGKPVIRGLSFSRVLSVYQGARFENQQWGADHGLGLNETGISSIEVIKGPASIIYGSGAMAGVIHLVEEPAAAMGFTEGDMNLRTFSNTLGIRTEAGVKGTSQNGLSWGVRGAAESHGDYRDGENHTLGNSRFSSRNFKGGLGLQKKWGDTKIRYSYLNQELGLIDENEPSKLVTNRYDRSMQLPYQQVQDHFMNSETTFFVGEDRIKLTLGYHWNIREEIETQSGEIDLGLLQKNFIYDLKYNKSLSKDLEAIVGIQGFYLQNINNKASIDILIPDAVKDDRSVYALLSLTKPKWIVQGGLRYDFRQVEVDAGGEHFILKNFVLPGNPEDRQLSRKFKGYTASSGATFKPDAHWRLRINVASGFRAPDLAELFSNGPHPGTSRFESGNASFEREQNIQGDLGIRYQSSDFTVSAEGFYNEINNYIFFSPTAEIRENLTVWRFEQAHAELYGGETYLRIHPSGLGWISGTTSYSSVIGRKKSDNSYLPYVPSNKLSQEVNLRFPNTEVLKQPYWGMTGSFFNAQNKIAAVEEATPGYFLLSTNLGTGIMLGRQKLDVYMGVNNLLHRNYLDHLSLYRPFGIHQAGRNFSMHLKMSF